MSKEVKNIDKSFIQKMGKELLKNDINTKDENMSAIFDIVNSSYSESNKIDNVIDKQELINFIKDIYDSDLNKDGNIDIDELKFYLKQNNNFANSYIKPKYIINFLNLFTTDTDDNTIADAVFSQSSSSEDINFDKLDNFLNNEFSATTFKDFISTGKNVLKSLDNLDNDKNLKYVSGLVDKAVICSDILGVDNIELKNIQKEIKEKGVENVSINKINVVYSQLFQRMESLNLYIEEPSQIDNSVYKSKNSFVKIHKGNKIIILNQQTNKTSTINMDKLLENFSYYEKREAIKLINELPVEVLMDISKEVTFAKPRRDLISNNFVGLFDLYKDNITLQSLGYVYNGFSLSTITHELGHAIDGIGKLHFESDYNQNFYTCFDNEMKEYLNNGNVRHSYDAGFGDPASNSDIYATANLQEMFAECYTLLMLGSCKSKYTILKYFPKTLNAAQEMLESIRNLPDKKRHKV